MDGEDVEGLEIINNEQDYQKRARRKYKMSVPIDMHTLCIHIARSIT